MVGKYLKGRKQGCDNKSGTIAPTVGQQYAAYHRWEIGESHDFPDMTCGDDYQEIAGECPHDGSKGGEIPLEVKCAQHNIESKEICEDVPYILR